MNNKNTYTISIDAMSGDYGLSVTIPASLNAIKKNSKLIVILVGIKEQIMEFLNSYNKKYDKKRILIYNADDIVLMNDLPSHALRKKKKSSMRIAVNMVKNNISKACVSAGNTGALMAISKFVLKTLPNINRPAIVYAIPTYNRMEKAIKSVYMLDLGANINCTSEQLFQFAIMGSILAYSLNDKKNISPRVSLLNIGEEEIKGLDNIKQAAEMLNNQKIINYIGFIEGHQIFHDITDVIVCDGFVGNIALKTIEGTAKLISDLIKDTFKNNFLSKLSMLGASYYLKKISNKLNTDKYNGASLLGLKGIVVKSHGRANIDSFEIAINQACLAIENNITQKIQYYLENNKFAK